MVAITVSLLSQKHLDWEGLLGTISPPVLSVGWPLLSSSLPSQFLWMGFQLTTLPLPLVFPWACEELGCTVCLGLPSPLTGTDFLGHPW